MAEKKNTKKASTTKKTVSQSKPAPKNTTKKVTSTVKKEPVANTNKVKATSDQNSSTTAASANAQARPSRRWLWILIPVLLLIGAGAWFVSSYVKTDSEGEVYVSNTRRFDQGELEDLKTGEKDGLTYQEVVARYGQPTKKTETTIGNVRTVVAVWADQNDDDDKTANTGVILYFQGTGDLNETRLTSKTGTYTTEDSKKTNKSNDSSSSKSSKTSSNSSSSK